MGGPGWRGSAHVAHPSRRRCRASLRMRSETLMARSAAMPRVSNREAPVLPASVLRTQLVDFGVARQEVRALLVGGVQHDALAVLQRGLADEGAERRLVVDLAERNLAERRAH